MKTVGLTGSIGMGKSTATNMLREMGIPVHDSDATVHELMSPGGAAVTGIARLCPPALKDDGSIDRKVLGKAFFADPALKEKVEGILFPLVKESALAFIEAERKKGTAIAVLDVPLLFEVGWDTLVDKTICVSASAEVQRARVLARPGMTEGRLQAVLAAQLPDAEKRGRADYVVDTGAGFDDTRRQLTDIVNELRAPPPKAAPRTGGPKP